MPASDSSIEKGSKIGISSFSMEFQGNSISISDTFEKKRIWRTLDIHLLPHVSLLYLLSFLYVANLYVPRAPLTRTCVRPIQVIEAILVCVTVMRETLESDRFPNRQREDSRDVDRP